MIYYFVVARRKIRSKQRDKATPGRVKASARFEAYRACQRCDGSYQRSQGLDARRRTDEATDGGLYQERCVQFDAHQNASLDTHKRGLASPIIDRNDQCQHCGQGAWCQPDGCPASARRPRDGQEVPRGLSLRSAQTQAVRGRQLHPSELLYGA